MIYDVIIVGLGGMGSAAFHQAAKRGLRCLGLDPNGIAHDRGSSHGETRLIRQAYFEHPDYVPLLKRAYEHWHELNHLAPSPVFHETGLVIFGNTTESGLLHNVLNSASLYGIPVEVLDHAEQQSRYPHFATPAGSVGVLEPGAGYLDVEAGVRLQIELALSQGGKWLPEGIVDWQAGPDVCRVKTTAGNEFQAKKLILCLGPWAPQLAKLPRRLRVHRVPLFWFAPRTEAYRSGPCYAFDFGEGFFYGFREQNGLVKVASHIPGDVSSPETVDRTLQAADAELLTRIVTQHLPDLNPEIKNHKVCMYTMSEDEHFYIDHHPTSENVVIAAGMSGHGYKFAPVIGEILTDLATTGSTHLPCDFLKIDR